MKKFFFFTFLIIFLSGKLTGKSFSTQNYISHEIKGDTLIIRCDESIIEIEAFTKSMIKVIFHDDLKLAVDSSYGVIAMPQKSISLISDKGSYLEYATDSLTLRINKKPVKLTYLRNGISFLSDTLGGFSTFEPYQYKGIKFGLDSNENIYGLGIRALPINRRNQQIEMLNMNRYGYEWGRNASLNVNIPLIVSSKNYGLFFDNHGLAVLQSDGDGKNILNYTAVGGKFSFFVINGSDFPDIYSKYTYLTGRQPLPPRWIFGYNQSRSFYSTDDEVRDIFDKMKADSFPVDGIVMDLSWFKYMGDFAWDPKFKEHVSFIKEFADKGIDMVLISDLYVSPNSFNYKEVLDNKLYAGDADGNPIVYNVFSEPDFLLLDLTNKKTLDWFWKKHSERTKEGIKGWWCDGGEPELHEPYTIHANGNSAAKIHNVYSNIWLDMLYNGFKKEYPKLRPLFFVRAGWSGIQRYGPFHLCGDEARSFKALKAMIPVMLGGAMSGLGYLHTDGGGYTSNDHLFHNELYVRWLQLGAFSPVFRVHMAGPVPAEPIFYPDSVKNIVREMANLRYEFLPYNYTLAYQLTNEGKPIMKPINFYEPGSPEISDINDEYLWGDNLLLAPVVDSVFSRTVYFPKGRWIDYFDGSIYEGSNHYNIDVPLSKLPLFVKSGSIIPLAPRMMNTKSYNSDTLIVKYYPDTLSPESSFVMYHDDGNSPNSLTDGNYELLNFSSVLKMDGIDFSIIRSGNGFSGMPDNRVITLQINKIPFKPTKVKIGDIELPVFSDTAEFNSQPLSAIYFAGKNEMKVKFIFHDSSIIKIIPALNSVADNPEKKSIIIKGYGPTPCKNIFYLNYELDSSYSIQITVFSLDGKTVYSENQGFQNEGVHSYIWNGTDNNNVPVSNGTYICRIRDINSGGTAFLKLIMY